MSILNKLLDIQEKTEPQIKVNPSSPLNAPRVVKEETENLFQQRHAHGPISKMDPTWKKNVDFLQKEIETAKRNLAVAETKRDKARDALSASEVHHQDCQKKLTALQGAYAKLEALIPEDDKKWQAPKEPQLLLEKKTPAKKAARKKAKKQ